MVHGVGQESMFRTALPYGVGALAVGTVGVITAVASGSTAGLIAGIALGIFGAYGFYGVLSCGFTSSSAQEFRDNVWKHVATAAGAGIANVLQFTIQAVIMQLVQNLFQSRRQTGRL